ncbi:MAG TPA: N-acetyl-gamma-glutamyl-phosphate reductase [Acidimicrobiia bacterium]|jgi:N-acetyl-gamma-glutamyl-phosphate reductase
MGASAAVFGASGYAGGELIRLIDGHPGFDLVYLGGHSRAGSTLGEVHPQLSGAERPIGPNAHGLAGPVDVAFLALPHGQAAALALPLLASGARVIDLGPDFRLDTIERYTEAYRSEHAAASELGTWTYGLPELVEVVGTVKAAIPGCYPTAVLLAIAPLLRAGVVEPDGVVADCLSGVTGAGRGLEVDHLFGEVAEGVRAYAVGSHRHRPEIEMALELVTGAPASVTFTPHLVPMQRGLLATVTARLKSDADPRAMLEEAYAKSLFVSVIDRPPQTRWTVGSNRALVAAFVDRGMVIAQCAIDNLLKGAAGQALQVANLMFGYEEGSGLPLSGWMP